MAVVRVEVVEVLKDLGIDAGLPIGEDEQEQGHHGQHQDHGEEDQHQEEELAVLRGAALIARVQAINQLPARPRHRTWDPTRRTAGTSSTARSGAGC